MQSGLMEYACRLIRARRASFGGVFGGLGGQKLGELTSNLGDYGMYERWYYEHSSRGRMKQKDKKRTAGV
jgi:hypothetical protein